MSDVIANLEPKLVWEYFSELSKIPRGSKHEAAAAKWVAEQGRKLGCEVIEDEVGNVVIRKKATPGRENRPGVVLQAHVDMVCEKNENTVHDFEKDPIRLRREGDHLYATGTTLGADNGIGVAAALAALASKDLEHGPLEALITIDEETGLTGANHFAGGVLQGKYFLNLDSEEEGYLTIGCAGGIDTIARYKAAWQAPAAGAKGYRVKVSGLKGGHSGIDINGGRGNAIRFLARVIYRLQQELSVALASIKGGNKRNAIAREASAVLVLDPAKEGALKALVARLEEEAKAALGSFDPNPAITVEGVDAPAQVMADADARRIVATLFTMVHGVVAMSPDIQGLVQTSTNLGVVDTKDGVVELNMLHRSSIDSSKAALVDRVTAHLGLAGWDVEHVGGYPGWKPEPDAELVKIVDGVQKDLFGKPMIILAIHAGLECGIIGKQYPGMQMVSIGPDMWDVHTPDEHLSIPSVANFWKLLGAVLAKI